MSTDLQKIIKHLLEAGFTEKDLADRAGCSQPTINRIKKGDTTDPAYSVGSALQAMHTEHFNQQVQP